MILRFQCVLLATDSVSGELACGNGHRPWQQRPLPLWMGERTIQDMFILKRSYDRLKQSVLRNFEKSVAFTPAALTFEFRKSKMSALAKECNSSVMLAKFFAH